MSGCCGRRGFGGTHEYFFKRGLNKMKALFVALCAGVSAPGPASLPASALGGSAMALAAASPSAPSSSAATSSSSGSTAALPLATPAATSSDSSASSAAPILGGGAPAAPRKGDETSSSSSSELDVSMGCGPISSGTLQFDIATPAKAPEAAHAVAASAASTAPSTPALGSAAASSAAVPALESISSTSAATASEDDSKIQKNKGRCWGCKKKVGLTGFECRCGYVFCGTHRYADQVRALSLSRSCTSRVGFGREKHGVRRPSSCQLTGARSLSSLGTCAAAVLPHSHPTYHLTSPPHVTLVLQHACSFDYKAHDRAVLAKANQKVVADKLEKV